MLWVGHIFFCVVVPWMSVSHQFVPVMCWRGCGWFLVCWALRDVQRAEHCWASGGMSRCSSKSSTLTLLCHFPLCLSSLWHSDTLPRHEKIYQDHSTCSWSSTLHSSPSLSSLADAAFPCWHIFPSHCLPVPVLWLLRYHFTCTFPSQERRSMVWCWAETCDFTEMPRVSNVPSSGMSLEHSK